jgi:hypothetical protein
MKEIYSVCVPVAAIAGTVVQPLWRVPSSTSGHGGVTLTAAYILSSAAATSQLQLVSGTAAGTSLSTAVGTLNGTLVANVQQAFSITTAYVSSGNWVGIKTNAGGSLATTNWVLLEYIWGK